MGLSIKQAPGLQGVAAAQAYGFQSHTLRPVSLGFGSRDNGLGSSSSSSSTLEEDLPKPVAPNQKQRRQQQHHQEQRAEQLDCPRCGSSNTKFCYYNNYNKSQPRHFCRACKRHWTKGGNLRNVPVGGTRKSKRVNNTKLHASTTTNSNSNNNISSSQGKLLPDQKAAAPTTTTTLFQGLIHPPFPTRNDAIGSFSVGKSSFLSPTLIPYQNPSVEISFASTSTTSTTRQKSNDYNQFERVDTILESAPIINGSSSQLWQNPIANSSAMEVPSYWGWNDLDSLVTTDDFSAIWDDTEIKF